MAARVITITSGKGGVGKTTATANLAVALALQGKKVACIDADIGLRNLDVVMGLENRIVYDIVDVVEGRAKLRQAMIKDKRLQEELYLIPAAQTRDKTAVSPSDMIRLCDELKQLVDVILVDSPAGIERGFRNAIAPADEVLIVTNPEVSSVRDADRIIGLIEAEQKGPGKLIINRVKADMVKRGDMLSPEDVIDILAIKLIGLVPEDENILVSTNRGSPAAMRPEESRAGRAFQNIARRLLGEDVPFMALEEDKGFMVSVMKALGLKQADSDSSRKNKPAEKPKSKPAEESPKAEAPALKAETKPAVEPVAKPLTDPDKKETPKATAEKDEDTDSGRKKVVIENKKDEPEKPAPEKVAEKPAASGAVKDATPAKPLPKVEAVDDKKSDNNGKPDEDKSAAKEKASDSAKS